MRYSVALLFAFALPLVVSAQTYSPFQFLRVNHSARAAALGESTVAMMEDPSMVVINPASVYSAPTGKLSATFVKNVLDINSGMASYVGDIGEHGKWSAVASYSSAGTFNESDEFGNRSGKTFSVGEVAIGGVYSNELDSGFYYGVGLNLVSSSFIDYRSTAIALNAGLLYHIRNSRWNVGFSILNLGTQLSTFSGTTEPLPLDVRLGVNHRLKGLPLLFNFSFNRLAEQNESLIDHFKNFSLGGEIYAGKVLTLRLGYNNTIRNAASLATQARLSGLNFGLGLKIKEIMIDYSMSTFISGALIHRVSIQTGL